MAFYSSLPGQTGQFMVEDDRVPQRVNSNQRVVENVPRQVRPVVQDYYPAVVNPVYQPTLYQAPSQPPVLQVVAAPAPTLAAASPTEKKCCTTPVIVTVLVLVVLVAVGIGIGVYFIVENDKKAAAAAQQTPVDYMVPCENWFGTYNRENKKFGNVVVTNVFQHAADKFGSKSIGQLFDDTVKSYGTQGMQSNFSPMNNIETVGQLAAWIGYDPGTSLYDGAFNVLCSSRWTQELFNHKPSNNNNLYGSSSYGCSGDIFQDIPMCY